MLVLWKVSIVNWFPGHYILRCEYFVNSVWHMHQYVDMGYLLGYSHTAVHCRPRTTSIHPALPHCPETGKLLRSTSIASSRSCTISYRLRLWPNIVWEKRCKTSENHTDLFAISGLPVSCTSGLNVSSTYGLNATCYITSRCIIGIASISTSKVVKIRRVVLNSPSCRTFCKRIPPFLDKSIKCL